MDHERVWEMLETCRSSDELLQRAQPGFEFTLAGHPEWTEYRRRVQQVDGQISRVFQEVPVPAGAADRILARLAGVQPEAVGEAVTAPPARSRPISRRWLFTGVGAVAAAAALLAMVMLGLNRWRPSAASALDAAVAHFASELNDPPSDYRFDAPRDDLPVSRHVVQPAQPAWRPLGDFLGGEGVAYDLPTRTGTRATLYVVRRSVSDLPSAPPGRPAWSSGNISAAAWQEGDLVYVLVVSGGEDDYRGCLRGGPLA